MGKARDFLAVKPFCGLIFSAGASLAEIFPILEETFSGIEIESPQIDFNMTDYYRNEMGCQLKRKFLGFRELIDPEKLPELKLACNDIEERYSAGGRRSVNIDPGYISVANVIIATTKNYYHRIPLEKGIYAHMEYVLKARKFCFLEWTYPDFRKESYLDFFNALFNSHQEQLRQLRAKGL